MGGISLTIIVVASALSAHAAALSERGEPQGSDLVPVAHPDEEQAAAPDRESPKLASATSDQTFLPITPCRIVDTRIVGGPIAAGVTRNYYFYSTSAAYSWSSQGGAAGSAGGASGACPGTVFPSGPAPSAAAVTVTVVAPSAAGNWIVWGGANPVPTISALNWNAGNIAANTTVITGGGRFGTGSGGAIRDFAVRYNGPSGAADFVADVVGYFIENQATALQCYETVPRSAGSSVLREAVRVTSDNCTAPWTLVKGNCDVDLHNGAMYLVEQYAIGPFPQAIWNCTYVNSNGSTHSVYASAICCRVPGR